MTPRQNQKKSEPRKREEEAAREKLAEAIDEFLDVPMAILAVIWAVLIVLDLAELVPPPWIEEVLFLEVVIWIAFLSEFVLEIAITPYRLQYLRTHWLVALSVAVPFFRVFHVVRIFGAFRSFFLFSVLLGTNRAIFLVREFFARHRVQYVVFVDAIVVVIGAAAVYFFERNISDSEIRSFGDALWWSATLITTINIGVDPVSFEGRTISFMIRVIALATFGYITASIASFLVYEETAESGVPKRVAEEEEKISEEEKEITRLREEVSALREALERLQSKIDKWG